MTLAEVDMLELYGILTQMQTERWGHISVFAFHHVNVLGSNPYHKQKQKQQKNVESQMHGRFYHLLILLFLKI